MVYVLQQGDYLEQIQLRHMHSQLGRHLYALMRGEPYEESTTLEDYTSTLPSGALVFRQLRARVYYIIQKYTKEGKYYLHMSSHLVSLD